ncbi:hypothetical protein HZA33_02325 [Candidatus Pacearchaeota archaeon]|nr:hypothetical protein [Candidatus Pacearchaeota archaeon]
MEKKFPKEEELILCTVDRILGTTVFVKLDEYNIEGVINTSEIAPGRIRNIRDYVTPNKRIVCKVIRIDEKGNIDLSLRRVSVKERNKLMEQYEKERNMIAILKIILKDQRRLSEITSKITEKETLTDFFERATEQDYLNSGLKKEEIQQLNKILEEKSQKKKVSLKLKISLSSTAENGLEKIKKILTKGLRGGVEITYLAAPHYILIITSADYKIANATLEEIKTKMEEESKKEGCKIEFVEQK